MARYVDMVLFARIMIVKEKKVGNNSHMNLLSYNRKFAAIHNKLSEAEKKMFPVKKVVTPFLKTLHISGMNILDDVDMLTLVMSMFGTGCSVRYRNE